MPQYFPNFVDSTPVRGAGPIQSKRVFASGLSSGNPFINLTWDAPFADANYTVSLALESIFVGDATIETFTKTATGISVELAVPNGTISATLHAVAFHD